MPESRPFLQPRMMAMEATIFTGWSYDYLVSHAEGEGSASIDAASDRRGQEEERQDIRPEDATKVLQAVRVGAI
jgi:hypothetical protein